MNSKSQRWTETYTTQCYATFEDLSEGKTNISPRCFLQTVNELQSSQRHHLRVSQTGLQLVCKFEFCNCSKLMKKKKQTELFILSAVITGFINNLNTRFLSRWVTRVKVMYTSGFEPFTSNTCPRSSATEAVKL